MPCSSTRSSRIDPGSRFHPRFEQFGLRVVTVLRFLPPDGAIRAFEYEGGDPGIVRLDPEWYQAAWTFVKMGFRHILDGADHLLFLFCLVIPFRRLSRPHSCRHGVHRGALDHAHRVGLRHGTRRALVSAAD